MTTENSGLSRRTLAKGAAWAAPAVVVAAATPAMAASCTYTLELSAASCKVAGGESNYKLIFVVVPSSPNCTPCEATITKVWQNTGGEETYWTGSVPSGTPITICNAPNMSSKVRVNALIPCIPLPEAGYYLVDMPNFNSSNNTCSEAPVCPA